MSQMNDVIWRKIKTIMEMDCSMMETKNISDVYWVEAVATAIYIMNQCLIKSLKKKFPQEASRGMKYNVAHFKGFGFVAYAHVTYVLRRKLDNNGHKCIFVGYFEDAKEYRLYDPVTRKIIISCYVQFVDN